MTQNNEYKYYDNAVLALSAYHLLVHHLQRMHELCVDPYTKIIIGEIIVRLIDHNDALQRLSETDIQED